MKPEYTVQIIWSAEDNAYLAAPLELPGCVADGQTQEEALKNLREIIQEWIEVAREEGRSIPEPITAQDQENLAAQFQAQLQRHIYKQVQIAVQQVMSQIGEQQQHPVWSPNVFRGVELVPGHGSRR